MVRDLLVVPAGFKVELKQLYTPEQHLFYLANSNGCFGVIISGTPILFTGYRRCELFEFESRTNVSSILNIVRGLCRPFKSYLKIKGLGYKFVRSANNLQIIAGQTHQKILVLKANLRIALNKKNDKLCLSGKNLASVFNTAALVRSIKKPDVYKGKGVRYRYERILWKEGKKQK